MGRSQFGGSLRRGGTKFQPLNENGVTVIVVPANHRVCPFFSHCLRNEIETASRLSRKLQKFGKTFRDFISWNLMSARTLMCVHEQQSELAQFIQVLSHIRRHGGRTVDIQVEGCT